MRLTSPSLGTFVRGVAGSPQSSSTSLAFSSWSLTRPIGVLQAMPMRFRRVAPGAVSTHRRPEVSGWFRRGLDAASAKLVNR
jgi:hypothetical protein